MKKLSLLSFSFLPLPIAQSYPTKPVRLIVTYPPGGSSDLMSRVYGAKLAELWGQQVIIESKPGAAGSIGMDFAAKQPNDGYTFVVGNLGPVAVNPLLSKVPYNIQKDFVAVSQISAGPNVLVVRADSPFKIAGRHHRVREAEPRQAELRHQRPGQRLAPVERDAEERPEGRARSRWPTRAACSRSRTCSAARSSTSSPTRCRPWRTSSAGKLRALCVTGTQKYELLPEPPTCQAAAPGLVAVNWWGVLYPAGTSKADRRQAARRHREGARRSRREEALRRPRRRGGVELAGRVRRLHQGRDGQVRQADQGSQHQGQS